MIPKTFGDILCKSDLETTRVMVRLKLNQIKDTFFGIKNFTVLVQISLNRSTIWRQKLRSNSVELGLCNVRNELIASRRISLLPRLNT